MASEQTRKTLGEQTYDFIKERILGNAYPPGSRLPSIRETAETLCVSRNTVERAYQQLLAEGYICSRQKSGYFVEELDKTLMLRTRRPMPFPEPPPSAPKTLGHPYDETGARYDFCYTNPAPHAFPVETWRKLTGEVLYSPDIEDINRYCNPFGDDGLRQSIARYIFSSRGVVCRPDQVIINTGLADGIDRLLKLFSPDRHCVACEDPCLSAVRTVILANRFPIETIDVSSHESYCRDLDRSKAKLIYVTPSHQFPTGATMALKTRLRLLEWAASRDAYVIEDDYDSEFRYKTKAIPSLHALDGESRVIYTGSFSKTLSPNMRVGYWVLPDDLAQRYRESLVTLPCSVPWLHQRVLCRFMDEGHWGKHLRKYVKLNRRKREILLDALESSFGGRMSISGEDAGLHLWVRLLDDRPGAELIDAARAADVMVYPVEHFYRNPSRIHPPAFIIGHSKIDQERIGPGIERLSQAWKV